MHQGQCAIGDIFQINLACVPSIVLGLVDIELPLFNSFERSHGLTEFMLFLLPMRKTRAQFRVLGDIVKVIGWGEAM